MTPKEKAEELFTTYRYCLSVQGAPLGEQKDTIAKQCALIAIDALLEHEENFHSVLDKATDYLQEVKQEIEKL